MSSLLLRHLIIGLISVLPHVSVAQSTEDAQQIAVEAYIYLYPLVTMDVTRRQMTNVEAGKAPGRAPMNTFAHIRAYPTAEFRDVVRPNFDTLYSLAWLDLTKEPVILSVPETQGRYYLLPFYDMWSDAFAVPGKRTSGTSAAQYALVPPHWHGEIPPGVEAIQSPTAFVWIIGRTQTNGPKDYDAVHKVQDGFLIVPLSQWGKTPSLDSFKADSTVDMKTPPLDQVNAMTGKSFFTYAAELMRAAPPHATDWSIVARMKRIGIEPGKSLSWDQFSPAVQEALNQAPHEGLKAMRAKLPTMAQVVNGWQMNIDTMGVYGNYYLKRAIVAMVGLGANQANDAVYPLNIGDASGKPLRGENKYVMHFDKSKLPPVGAFWSTTMYDEAGFQVANPINRFAIGDRDALKYNPDGSLDIYIQHENPGPDKESNWLPSPATGTLGITMRLYAPKPEVLEGRWAPPAVQMITVP